MKKSNLSKYFATGLTGLVIRKVKEDGRLGVTCHVF